MKILDIRVDEITKTEALKKFEQFLNSGKSHQIATVNAEFILTAKKDSQFKEILNNADLNVPDTVSMLWASTLQNTKLTKIPVFRTIEAIFFYIISGASIILNRKYISKILPERIPGADFVWDIAKIANDKKDSVFLLGGRDNVAQKTADQFIKKYPELKIVGVSEKDPNDKGIVEEIKKSKANIVMVAYGAPKQEKWLAENLASTGAKVGIGVGGTFDFISGKIKRAPKFIRNIGLEWLWRLFNDPRRAKRIYNAFIKFSLIVLIDKIKNN